MDASVFLVVHVRQNTRLLPGPAVQFLGSRLASRRNPTPRYVHLRLTAAQLKGELEREDLGRHGWKSWVNACEIFGFRKEKRPRIFRCAAAIAADIAAQLGAITTRCG